MTFIKGHTGFNKGIRSRGEYRNCLRCGKQKWVVESRILNGGGKYCSQDCSNKSTAIRGENNPNWKKKPGYWGVHSWLYRTFGYADICEKCGSTRVVQWAKLKGKKYLRKRENFWKLCAKCHTEYDDTCPKGWNKGTKGVMKVNSGSFKKGYYKGVKIK